jgi:hypothetical protein
MDVRSFLFQRKKQADVHALPKLEYISINETMKVLKYMHGLATTNSCSYHALWTYTLQIIIYKNVLTYLHTLVLLYVSTYSVYI